jgi:hypothetical protein
MELMIGFIVAVLGIFAAALSRQLTDEFKAWTPRIIKYLVNRAVHTLAEKERSRFEEEWLAHVNELPGEVGKIIAALGFLSAARRISLRISVTKRILDVVVSIILFFVIIPMMLVVATLIKVQDGGPVLIKREQKWNGQTVSVFKFRTEDIAGRRTPLGEFLQRADIAETPTLINILRGDISMPSLNESLRIVRRKLFP